MTDELSAWITESAPRALAYAVSLVRNVSVAEDLVQDCYQRLLTKSEVYDLPREGTKLLFKAVTNASINWTQREAKSRSLQTLQNDADFPVEKNELPLQAAASRELGDAVGIALGELPVEQRAVIELHVMGNSTSEIATMLELTAENVRVLRHRARKQLASKLRPFLENDIK
ncbi:RNA polymerase sigma factor SigX [Thalassoglobus neptunius]|uniref:RNA polymerase sigma factor SigX n=1 Tax=Thalassoglobus neptunius TaxID=1938619 RepID=A0A5C5VYG9_9PLAN|nr:RNA polymerase sigma factor [Thalassoglobus neptunius]TWT42791.1 RNA polymerase sigma factor SigX [Thalassoglobus neptunius]